MCRYRRSAIPSYYNHSCPDVCFDRIGLHASRQRPRPSAEKEKFERKQQSRLNWSIFSTFLRYRCIGLQYVRLWIFYMSTHASQSQWIQHCVRQSQPQYCCSPPTSTENPLSQQPPNNWTKSFSSLLFHSPSRKNKKVTLWPRQPYKSLCAKSSM